MKKFTDFLETRFGFPAGLLHSFGWREDQGGRVYLMSSAASPVLRPIAAGLWAGRVAEEMSVTSEFCQLFGAHFTRNRAALNREAARRYLSGENVVFEGEAADGSVLVEYEGIALGAGLLKGKALKNLLPRAKRTAVDYL